MWHVVTAQCRWMLAATEPTWENRGLSNTDEFEELKACGKLLYGQVPLLEIDGQNMVQSQTIIRYLANKHGLKGSTPKGVACAACPVLMAFYAGWGSADIRRRNVQEAALCDMVAEGCLDFRGGLLMYPFNPSKVATCVFLSLHQHFAHHAQKRALSC
eukprot:9136555-Pyramimonas_sp.AAC.1